MPVSAEFLDLILEMTAPLGGVQYKRMFGGASLNIAGMTFALLADDTLYFKTDDLTRPRFEAEGLKPFKPFEDKPGLMSYYTAPETALDDSDEMLEWARLALDAARRASVRKTAKKPAAKAAPAKRKPAKKK
jgi:DNA transformation protein